MSDFVSEFGFNIYGFNLTSSTNLIWPIKWTYNIFWAHVQILFLLFFQPPHFESLFVKCNPTNKTCGLIDLGYIMPNFWSSHFLNLKIMNTYRWIPGTFQVQNSNFLMCTHIVCTCTYNWLIVIETGFILNQLWQYNQ